MTPELRQRSLELNADHRQRMIDDFAMHEAKGSLPRIREQDAASRAALVESMLQHRPHGGIVLELGTGWGFDCEHLTTHLAPEYRGIDVVPLSVASLGDPRVRVGSVEELPAEWLGTADFIYSRHVMEHVVDVDTALASIRRTLKPGGVVGAVTPHVFPDPEPAHVTQLDTRGWRAAYERHGFRVVSSEVLAYFCTELHLVAV